MLSEIWRTKSVLFVSRTHMSVFTHKLRSSFGRVFWGFSRRRVYLTLSMIAALNDRLRDIGREFTKQSSYVWPKPCFVLDFWKTVDHCMQCHVVSCHVSCHVMLRGLPPDSWKLGIQILRSEVSSSAPSHSAVGILTVFRQCFTLTLTNEFHING